jgi:hypothetical protein
MKIDHLSAAAQEGLRQWAKYQHGDDMLFDGIGGNSEAWAWLCIQLKAASDRREWFPKGKWATIQYVETILLEEAFADRRAAEAERGI